MARKIQVYQAGLKAPTAIDLHKELNALKKTELSWMYEVSKCAPQEALRNLDKAFANFFRRVKEKKAGKFTGKVGFPNFKARSRGLGSFRLTGSIRIFSKRIKLPCLGWLRLKESGYLPVEGVVSTHRTLDGVKILSATVSERSGRWFVSVQVSCWFDNHSESSEYTTAETACGQPTKKVEQEIAVEKAQGEPCGVDLGIKSLAVCSDLREFENPKALRKSLKKLRRAQRELSRRKKGGKNREKSRQKVARLHYRIANIRSDAIHKATTSICCLRCTHQDDSETQIRIDEHKANDIVAKTKPIEQRPSVVVIEDLNVSGMLKNHKLARAISDVGFFELASPRVRGE